MSQAQHGTAHNRAPALGSSRVQRRLAERYVKYTGTRSCTVVSLRALCEKTSACGNQMRGEPQVSTHRLGGFVCERSFYILLNYELAIARHIPRTSHVSCCTHSTSTCVLLHSSLSRLRHVAGRVQCLLAPLWWRGHVMRGRISLSARSRSMGPLDLRAVAAPRAVSAPIRPRAWVVVIPPASRAQLLLLCGHGSADSGMPEQHLGLGEARLGWPVH